MILLKVKEPQVEQSPALKAQSVQRAGEHDQIEGLELRDEPYHKTINR